MGKMTSTSADLAQSLVTGTLAAVGLGSPIPLLGNFNGAIWGTFVGTIQMQTSFDGGVTWIPVINKRTGQNIVFTAPGALQEDEVEPGVLYAFACTAYTSGTINYRISEGAAAGRLERLT